MRERLSWDQIVEQYPDQYVYLTDVEYADGPGVAIISAVVRHSSDSFDNPYIGEAISGEVEEYYTTPNGRFQLGALTV